MKWTIGKGNLVDLTAPPTAKKKCVLVTLPIDISDMVCLIESCNVQLCKKTLGLGCVTRALMRA